MGKGGGCVPSKKKIPSVLDDPPHSAVEQSRDVPIHVEDNVSEADVNDDTVDTPIQETGSQQPVPKLRIYIVFHSMYGHVEGLARRMKEGVDGVDGIEGILYRVPETLPIEVLQQMKAPLKDESIPEISAAELATADGLLFGFPTRYGSMAAQMKAFFDSTGQLWKEQKLAGKPAGFFVSTGTQGGGQETTA